MSKERTVPVAVGQAVECEIVGLTHEGEGVGRYRGFTLFVHGALPGEQVRAKVISVGKSFGKARMTGLVLASPDRRAAPCPIYDACGGCQLQHLDYPAQLHWKRRHVVDNLVRVGKLPVEGEPVGGAGSVAAEGENDGADTAGKGGDHGDSAVNGRANGDTAWKGGIAGSLRVSGAEQRAPVRVHPTIGMPDPWRYRNKAQVPIGRGEAGLIGGFFEESSHDIVDMEACLIQQEANEETVRAVKEAARTLGISAYDRVSGRGLLRHVVVRHAAATGQRMVVLVTNGRDIPHEAELVGLIREQVPGVVSVVQNVNTTRTPVVFGETTRTLWGEDVIYDEIGCIRFAISARSFFQVNPEQTELLYRKAVECAGLTGEETVVDAYCGIGTITLFLARHARRVYGVEIVPEAIEDARRNAQLNGIGNVEFAVGRAEAVLPRWQKAGVTPDVIVVDPPRKGCDPALIATMLELRPARIVYVSCNPSTLARDLRLLEDGGYRTVEVQPVDMFPHTSHVECVAMLENVETPS
ncbi:23S rRNA (uracil(1939)-C(5))-methyltransferase RlmD [Cohnella sp. CFH 77786]|uniref:23S rRNA (uracil(1939)-C(5))-methyltransferase RlmD n=1 Tax=Cohnella sp. CFH 77786 TaxID=2662265 RepID=UPI001C60FFFC|nr:23S rRNA (uracil(1939)-C(5))-methyltransferase RlmD [Cohnella sp. CFH 77786]MBW5445759.1 23S rRNA (uracil(1939)-C(5))-methyltransferase RlmD [Cohnella sp. CFH 77786]